MVTTLQMITLAHSSKPCFVFRRPCLKVCQEDTAFCSRTVNSLALRLWMAFPDTQLTLYYL